MRIEGFANPKALAAAAAGFIAERAENSAGRFSLALAGGSTPLLTYGLLGRQPFSHRIPWKRVHLFWSDERCVPTDHPESNVAAALSALGPPKALPKTNIHPIMAGQGPEKGAAAYESELRAFFGPSPVPAFDLMLLGLGPDGHTASLFPGSPGLEAMDRWVIGGPAPEHLEPRVARVTLTLPALNAARTALFLVTGPKKADMVRKILSPKSEAEQALPAARVQPREDLIWFLDREAAQDLEKRP